MPSNVALSKKVSETPLSDLVGMTSKTAKLFTKLGLETVWQLLLYLPSQYQNRSQITPIRDLLVNKPMLIQGQVNQLRLIGRSRKILQLAIDDGTGMLTVNFFKFNPSRYQQLSSKPLVRCFGEVKTGSYGLAMNHPELSLTQINTPLPEHWLPIYPSTKGLQQFQLRKYMQVALKQYLPQLTEISIPKILNAVNFEQESLPSFAEYQTTSKSPLEVLQQLKQYPLSLSEALTTIHFPPINDEVESLLDKSSIFHLRLIIEELVSHQLASQQIRATLDKRQAVSHLPAQAKPIEQGDLVQQYVEKLPFSLTTDQQTAITEIKQDMQQAKPMMRLLQGDVGSGKTVVAFMTMLYLVQRQWQCVLMAPTELLALQHFEHNQPLLSAIGVDIELLIGRVKSSQRRRILDKLKQGKPMILVGTHAVFQSAVDFKNLGLAVIDEQHRFGVNQRLSLLQKSQRSQTTQAHQLFLTATPIPRTLTMALYSDLSQSILKNKPSGRLPIQTSVINNQRINELYQSINKQVAAGKQVYWVCLFIEESEFTETQSIDNRLAELQGHLAGVDLTVLHGRMDETSKQKALQDFRNKRVDLLLATTIVEVGIDVPNASIMVIENAERLGLAQLHQIRGRVGRSNAQSQCVLLYQPPLREQAKQRLDAMRQSNDGFYLADLDLRLRGGGDLYGTRQSGSMALYIADLYRDYALIPVAKQLASSLTNQQAIETLIERWKTNASEYSQV